MTHQNPDNSTAKDFLEVAIADLQTRSSNLTGAGILIFLIAIVFGVFLFFDIKDTTTKHLDDLNIAVHAEWTLVYLVIRSAALGTVAITLLVVMVRTAVACFDQSTRFAKRRYGAMFLQYIYQKHDQTGIQKTLSIEEIMKFFEAWNQNIESAFSSIKIDKKESPLEVSVNKEGVTYRSGKR